MSESHPQPTDLPRQLGLWSAISLVVGTVIGVGIFLVPSIMARYQPSAGAILGTWILGGLLSYFGALAYAELGTMFPATGGQYVFLRESYGPMIAFLCGWTLFLVVMTGNIAFLATGLSAYLQWFVPLTGIESRAVAVLSIALFTFINYRGIRLGSMVQNLFTVLKLTGIAVLVFAAFASRHPSQSQFTPHLSDFHPHQIGLALAVALVAYEGWNNLSFINGEIRNPSRNIPIALGVGVAICGGVYVLVTAAYLRAMPVAALASSSRVGTEVATRLLGPVGAVFITVTILISILGSTNGTVLMCPRLCFAQAEDGLFFRRFARIHPRFQTPSFAIVMQGIWASILALTGSYELLATYAIFCAWFFYLLVVVGLIILRWRRPLYPRPYRMWGYPVTPLLFAAITTWFLINSLMTNPVPSFAGMIILASGIPVYWLWTTAKKRNTA